MTLDLSGLPLVDSHCHLFLPQLEDKSFDRYWTLSTLPLEPDDIHSSVLFQMMRARLARFLGLSETVPFEEVAAERARRYHGDPTSYIGALFADAGIGTVLIDIGYPSEEDEGIEIDTGDFRALLEGQDMRIIVRIEPVMYSLLKRKLSFAEFVDEYRSELLRQLDEHAAVALKTTIAYYTGLEVRPVARGRAERAYGAVAGAPAGEADQAALKEYRDFFLLEALEVAMERGLPMQVHTGMGDSPEIDIRLADPSHLRWLIADDHFGKATVVLVHGGYPHHAAAGFLVSAYPNVWLDVSEMVPFVGPGVTSRLLELFEMAPLSKIMYGSDGFNIPEVFWFAAVQFRRGLSEALESLVAAGHVSHGFALEAAGGILRETARRLYRL
jgi:predicted TIM-barrel fold metal-dependent hydrolase